MKNKTKVAIGVTTELVKEVYEDALQPATKQVGKSLETIGKLVNVALAPITITIWGYEKISIFLTEELPKKLKNTPEENIITPPPEIAGPAIEALRFAGSNENLRNLYLNLLANSMDKDTIQKAHPSFVEILKNLTSDEALLLKVFIEGDQYPLIDIQAKDKEKDGFINVYSNYSHFSKKQTFAQPDLMPSYIDNLCRLGILEIPAMLWLAELNIYETLEADEELNDLKKLIQNKLGKNIKFGRKVIKLTSFGKQFIENVVVDKK
jgi:hypothetical protein